MNKENTTPPQDILQLHLPPPYQDSAEEGRLILRDGTTATIRPTRPEDADLLNDFFNRLSSESKHHRFFSAAAIDPELIRNFCNSSDRKKQFTLIVTRHINDAPYVIATGSYLFTNGNSAEVAFAVEDDYQGNGLGTLLLERLSVIALTNGISRFVAITQNENKAMLEVFHQSGMQIHELQENGYVNVDFSVLPSEQSIAKTENRDRLFTTASLLPFFKPRSVVVVGASRDPTSIGYRTLHALISNKFHGALYAVNPKAHAISGIRCYPTVKDIPEQVDLAVIVVPRDAVLSVVDDCAEKGVRALIVISAGFAEVNEEGKKLQQKLVEKARGYGMRLIGPNCLGLINTDPVVQLNASFSPTNPPVGNIAMLSQSGALGLAVLGQARRVHLGLSSFVSVGNKADVSGNDLLQYWEGDERTTVILLYLESFGNPRRFARLARRVSYQKPIICVKGGRSSSGGRAAGSHTASLAANDIGVDALFQQTGVIRAETLEEMFDTAALLSTQPLPSGGRRVGIITNAGGPGILCTDACEARGLRVVEFSPETKKQLASFLPASASVSNPVDMIASATPEYFQKTIETVLAANEIDALVVIFIPVGVVGTEAIAKAIGDGVSSARKKQITHKPVIACLMTEEGKNPPIQTDREIIPTYSFPETAALVLSHAADYADWRKKPHGIIPNFTDINPAEAQSICRHALQTRGPGWLNADETYRLLQNFSLPLPSGGVAKTEEEAVQIAQRVGYPVVLKLASLKIIHKTEYNAVRLNLKDEHAVRNAFQDIRKQLEEKGQLDAMDGVVIQPMLREGIEVMIGVSEDPLFGPLIAFGLGGIYVEVLNDVCFRTTPLTDQDAHEMVHNLKGQKLLEGYRGHAPADLPALEKILLRISLMVEEISEITQLDLNPVFALSSGQGAIIADARIYVDFPGSGRPTRYAMASTGE